MSTPPDAPPSGLDAFDNKWGLVIGVLVVILAAWADASLVSAAAHGGSMKAMWAGVAVVTAVLAILVRVTTFENFKLKLLAQTIGFGGALLTLVFAIFGWYVATRG